eukprot:CAMPEP_0114131880 /NCGR_PEP_ID=MMETSP0043_2-20121206/12791_1 /TAXON_ID=464988 /ORGANISM="Hemiselmis andersenii, Strain CCMP644" /LENGTH=84 /DNA_ID=CAMNT_0001225345 /DNA_START=26 /DNA_END=280 /DNA_ORIENTATION=-
MSPPGRPHAQLSSYTVGLAIWTLLVVVEELPASPSAPQSSIPFARPNVTCRRLPSPPVFSPPCGVDAAPCTGGVFCGVVSPNGK